MGTGIFIQAIGQVLENKWGVYPVLVGGSEEESYVFKYREHPDF